MGSMKGAGALIAALVPIAYCGAMVYYFMNVGGGSVQGVTAMGLGPTVLGLGALGLLFLVPLLVKLIRLTTATPPAKGNRPRFSDIPEEEAFDADAALARYMARKAEGGEAFQPVTDANADHDASPAVRPTFGRKIA